MNRNDQDVRTAKPRSDLITKGAIVGSELTNSTIVDRDAACNFEFSDQPDWIPRPRDPFLAAMLLADMNQDGMNDLVLASGGDVRNGMSPLYLLLDQVMLLHHHGSQKRPLTIQEFQSGMLTLTVDPISSLLYMIVRKYVVARLMILLPPKYS